MTERSSAVTAGTTDEAEADLFESMVLGAMHATLSSAVIEAMTVIERDDDFAIQRATLPTILFAKEILARAPAQRQPASSMLQDELRQLNQAPSSAAMDDMRDPEVARALRLEEAARAPSQQAWMSVDTAPKDGSKVDLLYPYPRGRTINCEWRSGGTNGDGRWVWLTPRWEGALLLDESQWNVCSYPNMDPTHWMRSPALPSKCRKCGAETKGEEALVNGEIWCHPCADSAPTTALPSTKSGSDHAG